MGDTGDEKKYYAVANRLIKKGADDSIRNKKGQTPLDILQHFFASGAQRVRSSELAKETLLNAESIPLEKQARPGIPGVPRPWVKSSLFGDGGEYFFYNPKTG